MSLKNTREGIIGYTERIGRQTIAGVEEIGNGGFLLLESFYWLFVGPRLKQPVRFGAVIMQMMEIGIKAIPLIAMMAGTIGAMMATSQIAKSLVPGTHASTFGGNPLACAAATAVIEAIEQDHLLDNAIKMGQYAAEKLNQLKELIN